MQVMILCGGLGTRLREETEVRPKPMVEIGGRPILWHIMKTFGHHGLREFVLCLGYKGSLIKDYFLNYEAMNNDVTVQLGARSSVTCHGEHSEQDYAVTLAETGQTAQTGARIKRVERFVDGPRCIVTYGDVPRPSRIPELSNVIARYKADVTRSARKYIRDFKMQIWQARFNDRVVRDENELSRIRQYILTRHSRNQSRGAAFFAPGGRLALRLSATFFISVVRRILHFSRKISSLRY